MLFLFLVLLFGLLGCSFLGGSCRREGLTNQFPTNTSPPSSSSSSSPPSPPSSSSSSSSPPSNYNPLLPPAAASKDNYNHYSDGISSSQIPKGSEDLYILKSQIVPQVCPAGASTSSSSSPSVSGVQGASVTGSGMQGTSTFPSSTPAKCPPCPACERCDEPSYDCKLVPNYNAFNSKKMPVPVLSDFSTFGM
jgi:hypothetical protein